MQGHPQVGATTGRPNNLLGFVTSLEKLEPPYSRGTSLLAVHPNRAPGAITARKCFILNEVQPEFPLIAL
jgi:hypothetical protein